MVREFSLLCFEVADEGDMRDGSGFVILNDVDVFGVEAKEGVLFREALIFGAEGVVGCLLFHVLNYTTANSNKS